MKHFTINSHQETDPLKFKLKKSLFRYSFMTVKQSSFINYTILHCKAFFKCVNSQHDGRKDF